MFNAMSSPAAILVILTIVQTGLLPAQTAPPMKFKTANTGKGYAICGSCDVPGDISQSVWLADSSEAGIHIVIRGIVYHEDGVTPDSGISMFLYQADAGGYYHRPEENVFEPRLHGWLRTGKDGRYEIHTVKPSPEILAADEPAHFHAHVFGRGIPEHFLHEFWFEEDKRISSEDLARFDKLGTFSPVIRLMKGADALLYGTRNIRIRPAAPWRYEPE